MDEVIREPGSSQKTPLDGLTKDELLNKCKSLLTIAKKAKSAKDEISHENRKLKDALAECEREKKSGEASILTMNETLEKYTQNKLELVTQFSETQNKYKNVEEHCEELKIENESLRRQLSRMTEDNEMLLGDIDHMEDQLKQVNVLGTEQKKNCELLEIDIAKLRKMDDSNAALKSQIQELTDVNSDQRKKFNALKVRFSDVYAKLKSLRQCKKMLLETHHEYAATVSKWQKDIRHAADELCGRLNALQKENIYLKSIKSNACNKIKQKIVELENAVLIALEEHRMLKTEHEHLNESYTALKTKFDWTEGTDNCQDSSSNLSHIDFAKKIEQLRTDLEIANSKHADIEASYNELAMRFKTKESEHTEVLDEMRELNEALKHRGDHISKLQQRNDELASELKKSATKQNEVEAALNSSQEKLDDLRRKLREVELEMHCDNACAEVDNQSDSLFSSTLSRSDNDNNYEERYCKLLGIAAKLKKKLLERTASLKEIEQKLTLAEEANEILNSTKSALLQEQANLIAENKKLKSTRKQANVLSLEIEAAEKSLADTSAKLAAKLTELDVVNEKVTCRETTIEQLRKELEITDAAKEAEVIHARQLKEQIDLMQSQVKDAVHERQQVLVQNKELEQSAEMYKRELEELRANDQVKFSDLEAKLANSILQQDALVTSLKEAETRVSELESNLSNTKRTMEDIRSEYADYKVKAQLVLRKNQTKETTRERELEAELKNLRSNEQSLQGLVQSQIATCEQLKKHIELLQEDKDCLQQKNSELLHSVDELRAEIEIIKLEKQSQILNLQETLTNQQTQLDTIEQCNKAQLRHLIDQLEEVKSELEKFKRKPTIIGAPAQTNLSNEFVSDDLEKIDALLAEREAGEGSEELIESFANLAAKRKISSSSRRSQQDFMPLSELLNTPLANISDSVISVCNIDVDNRSEPSENMHLVLQLTREQLEIQESRVRHLTSLLAENEQDLAKLTQMNDMLKEELRRQERSQEREQHMHNSEYIKNVFLKFLTLNSGDERIRLVPVLNTIFKLSPSETEILNSVAKGQKVTNDLHARGWGNFFSSLTGAGSSVTNNNTN